VTCLQKNIFLTWPSSFERAGAMARLERRSS
jgi:hypothetical protein